MSLVRITSLDDPRVAAYRELTTPRRTEREGRFIVEGKWLVERLLASTFSAESVLVEEHRLSEIESKLPSHVTTCVVSRSMVRQIVGFDFHRGMLACGVRPAPQTAEERRLVFQPACWTAVACVGVCDPQNLGVILRNCAAFGIRQVLLGPACADHLSRRVMRVSMGAVFSISVHVPRDLGDYLASIRQEFRADLTATVLDSKAESLDTYRAGDRTVLVFGSEGQGLDARWIERCNRRATIPMQLQTDSLNVGVASGIFLHALARQSSGGG